MAGFRTQQDGDGAAAANDDAGAGAQTSSSGHGGAGTGPRTAKACTNCSVKKRRCDGGQPECSVCSSLGITCTYNNHPLRRGPPKGFRADPETSAKAKLMRKLETTIRDLVAQLGKEQAAREVWRVSRERGIDDDDMELAKAEPQDGNEAAAGSYQDDHPVRSPKRARIEPRAGPHASTSAQHQPTFSYTGSGSSTPVSQHPQMRSGYGPAARNGQNAPPMAHPHPHLAHLAHEASMLRRAHSAGPGQQGSMPLYTVKTQEEDDDFLGVNERGDLMHRGSSSGIGLLNRTHTQIQQHTQQGPPYPGMYPTHERGPYRPGSPSSDRHSLQGGFAPPGSRVYLPPISTIQVESGHFSTASPLGMAGTVPLPLALPFGGPLQPGVPLYPPHGGSSHLSPAAAHPTPGLHSVSSHSSPAPYDDPEHGAYGGSHQSMLTRRPSFERGRGRRRGRSPPPAGRLVDASSLIESRPYRRLKDEHRMSSLSPARVGDTSARSPPRRRGSQRSDDHAADEMRADFNPDTAQPHHVESPLPMTDVGPGTAVGAEGLPRIHLTQEDKNLLFKFYYSDFHPFWPVLFKPALDAIPLQEVPDRLDDVLVYAIFTMGAAVMPNTPELDSNQDSAEHSSAISRLRAMAPTFYACAEAHLFAGRLRPTVSAIQSLFLLSLYSHGCGELSRAWVYSGLACAMLMDLGLHRWPIHRIELLYESAERETRTRLIWCVYILDKVLSAEMGRPVILRATDCDAPFLSEVEADELEPWTGSIPDGVGGPDTNGELQAETTQFIHAPSCLNWGIRLFQIVEKILSSVHAFRRKAQLRHNANAHHILVEIDKELSRWKTALPDWLSFERLENTRKAGQAKDRENQARASQAGMEQGQGESSVGPVRTRPLPSFFALHLWYFTSTLLLHRPFIPQDEGALMSEVLANESHRKCTEAANTICDLVESSSTPVDRLSTDLAYCIFTAAVLQLFNARLADEEIASSARRRLNLCRQWLKQLSETWPAASAHKQLLDGFSIVGQGAVEDTEVQLGLEAAAIAVAADAEAAATASAMGRSPGDALGRTGPQPEGVRDNAEPERLDDFSLDRLAGGKDAPPTGLTLPTTSATGASSGLGPRPLEQHSGAQLRNPANSTSGAATSPSLFAMPGSGRLTMFNGTSPLNIPVFSVTRSPFFSLNAGKPIPGLGGNVFMLDGGGSALGTGTEPVTAQQRAQMAQYQAYIASFQSRYANVNASTSQAPGGAAIVMGSSMGANTAAGLGNGGANVGLLGSSSSAGTWMIPNTSMASLGNPAAGPSSLRQDQLGQDQASLQLPTSMSSSSPAEASRVASITSLTETFGGANEIMTPMRMVNAEVQAQQVGRSSDAFDAAGGNETVPVSASGPGPPAGSLDLTTTTSIAMPSIMADAPVGLWDIENFFWNERAAGATSSNANGSTFGNGLSEPAMDQPGVGMPVDQRTGPSPSDLPHQARSTPSTVLGLPPPLRPSEAATPAVSRQPGPPPPSSGPYPTNNGSIGAYATSGSSGPAASFQQLYSQVHSRKMSNNANAGNGGVATGLDGDGSVPTARADGLSMLAEVTAAGSLSDRTAVAAGGSTGGMESAPPTGPNAGAPSMSRYSANGNPMGTPMLGVQPTRRLTPLVGTSSSGGSSGSGPGGVNMNNNGSGGTGTPSFGVGGTGNTPLFNIGMGLGMSATGSNSGFGGGLGGGNNSIISLSPFGFSMTPDPVVWDALALLELPPSFAKV